MSSGDGGRVRAVGGGDGGGAAGAVLALLHHHGARHTLPSRSVVSIRIALTGLLSA